MGWFDGIRESNRHKRDLAEQKQERQRRQELIDKVMQNRVDYASLPPVPAVAPGQDQALGYGPSGMPLEGGGYLTEPDAASMKAYTDANAAAYRGGDYQAEWWRPTRVSMENLGKARIERPPTQQEINRGLMAALFREGANPSALAGSTYGTEGQLAGQMRGQDLMSMDRRRGQDMTQATGIGRSILAHGGALPQFGIDEPLPVPEAQRVAALARAGASRAQAGAAGARQRNTEMMTPFQMAESASRIDKNVIGKTLAEERINKILREGGDAKLPEGGDAKLPEGLKILFTTLVSRIAQIRSNAKLKPYEQDAQVQALLTEFAPLLPGIVTETVPAQPRLILPDKPAKYGLKPIQGAPRTGGSVTPALSVDDVFGN